MVKTHLKNFSRKSKKWEVRLLLNKRPKNSKKVRSRLPRRRISIRSSGGRARKKIQRRKLKSKSHKLVRNGRVAGRNGFLLARRRLESDAPHVLFVEKNAVQKASRPTADLDARSRKGVGSGAEDGGAGAKCFRIPLDEDARVDVPRALETLGVPKIQFESQPGVWRALKGYSATGKSIPRFRNHQQVQFRVGGSFPTPRVREERPWVDDWLVEGDTEALYDTRVSRIVQKTHRGRIGVGTMVRVQSSLIPGLMLTCRHCVEMNERGSINEKLFAFGGPITVLYLSNKYDLALCRGPIDSDCNHAFRLAEEGEEETGREVRMLSYPWHVDLVYGLMENVGPTQVQQVWHMHVICC